MLPADVGVATDGGLLRWKVEECACPCLSCLGLVDSLSAKNKGRPPFEELFSGGAGSRRGGGALGEFRIT